MRQCPGASTGGFHLGRPEPHAPGRPRERRVRCRPQPAAGQQLTRRGTRRPARARHGTTPQLPRAPPSCARTRDRPPAATEPTAAAGTRTPDTADLLRTVGRVATPPVTVAKAVADHVASTARRPDGVLYWGPCRAGRAGRPRVARRRRRRGGGRRRNGRCRPRLTSPLPNPRPQAAPGRASCRTGSTTAGRCAPRPWCCRL